MTVKEQLHKVASDLKSNASIEEAIEKLIFLHKIETGLKQADEEKVISHDEVEKRVKNWFK